jgi:biotin carboxyl carrier protein
MSKHITFQFQGSTYDVQVERQDNTLFITRDGSQYQVDLVDGSQTVSNGQLSAVPRGASAPAAPRAAAPAPAAVRPAAPAAAPAPAAAGAGAESAPITGTVKEIKVAVGDSVQEGQLIVMMEAMKMDIEVFSNRAGTVQAILVNPGDSVREGQALLNLG